jgi:RNA polymerase-binding transcription factor DksA
MPLPSPDATRRVLERQRDSVRTELAGLTAPPEDAGSIQFGKRAGDATNVAAEQLSRVGAHAELSDLLVQTERALAKLDAGTYGRCDTCGEAIAPERLVALPWASECMACRSGPRARR